MLPSNRQKNEFSSEMGKECVCACRVCTNVKDKQEKEYVVV